MGRHGSEVGGQSSKYKVQSTGLSSYTSNMMKRSAILCMAAVLLASVTGCEVKTRYRVLCLLFDGVPTPPGMVPCDSDGRPLGSSVVAKSEDASTQGYTQHGPYAARLCEGCHQRQTNKLLMAVEDLCFNCHDLSIRKRIVHGPVASGSCVVCHDPHGSGNKYLLVAKSQEFCLHCHKKEDLQKTDAHQDLNTGCTTCHNAHASDNDYLLISKAAEGYKAKRQTPPRASRPTKEQASGAKQGKPATTSSKQEQPTTSSSKQKQPETSSSNQGQPATSSGLGPQKNGNEGALHQVAADGLAHLGLVAGEVQDVVYDLEGHPEVVAVVTEGGDPILGRPADDRTALAGGGEEGCRLAADAVQVVADRLAAVVSGHVLADLARGHDHQRLREELDDAQAVRLHHLVGGVGEEEVAEHHCRGVLESAVHGGPAPARVRGVDDVVVHQRRRVQELDGSCQRRQELQVVLAEPSRQERERRAQQLAPASQHHPQHLAQGAVVHVLDGLERLLDLAQVFLDGPVEEVRPQRMSPSA